MNLMNDFFSFAWSIRDSNYSFIHRLNARKELNYNRKTLDKLTLSRLKKIIDYASKKSDFYKKKFKEYSVTCESLKSIDDLAKFPFLTRDHLRDNINEIVTQKTELSKWNKRATGGTTSSPVEFYCNQNALWKKNAFSYEIDKWYGKYTGCKSVFLWGAPQDFPAKQSFGMRLRNYTYQRSLMLPSSPLDDKIMEDYYVKLNDWKPEFLQAYPTPLYEFCLYLKKNKLKMPYLKSASVTAEPLLSYHRFTIEEVLGFRIFNWYGSRELGRVASECEIHNGLHINEPCVYVEIIPDSELPEGYGHLVITDLLNYATPFIRYRTGDIAAFKDETCPCGKSLRMLSKIEGRTADVILLPNGKKIPGVSLTNRIIKGFEEFVELQIIQKNYLNFVVKYVKGRSFSNSSLENFVIKLCEFFDIKVEVEFIEVEKLDREKSGKVRFVKNEMV